MWIYQICERTYAIIRKIITYCVWNYNARNADFKKGNLGKLQMENEYMDNKS